MSGLILAEGVPSTSRWQVVDFVRLRAQTAPAAGGVAQLDLGQLPNDELWLIDRAVVSCSSTSKTTLRLYEDAAEPGRYLSGSAAGNFDEADYPGGLQIGPTGRLVAAWFGATDGAVGQLYVQGRRLKRT